MITVLALCALVGGPVLMAAITVRVRRRAIAMGLRSKPELGRAVSDGEALGMIVAVALIVAGAIVLALMAMTGWTA